MNHYRANTFLLSCGYLSSEEVGIRSVNDTLTNLTANVNSEVTDFSENSSESEKNSANARENTAGTAQKAAEQESRREYARSEEDVLAGLDKSTLKTQAEWDDYRAWERKYETYQRFHAIWSECNRQYEALENRNSAEGRKPLAAGTKNIEMYRKENTQKS